VGSSRDSTCFTSTSRHSSSRGASSSLGASSLLSFSSDVENPLKGSPPAAIAALRPTPAPPPPPPRLVPRVFLRVPADATTLRTFGAGEGFSVPCFDSWT